MKGRICLVTGASTGIGYVTALELAKMGASVVMVNRDPQRGEKAKAAVVEQSGNADVELLLCDLSSRKQVRALAAEILRRHERLHVLVNNAAVVPARRRLTEDGIEMQFAVNHLAYFSLTALLLDTLKTSAPARVVSVSSGMHTQASLDFRNLQAEITYKPMKHYALTKLLNLFFALELARRLEGTGVTSNAMAPGFTSTNLGREYSFISRLIVRLMAQPKEKGAETVIYLASSPEVEGVTGKYFAKKAEASFSPQAKDPDKALKLWELSAALSGLA
jgi:NAD(P)-dependent dehydrogenase (short-subunit alcohol dehydrogenase family)